MLTAKGRFSLDFSGLYHALEAGTDGLLTAHSYDGEQHRTSQDNTELNNAEERNVPKGVSPAGITAR